MYMRREVSVHIKKLRNLERELETVTDEDAK